MSAAFEAADGDLAAAPARRAAGGRRARAATSAGASRPRCWSCPPEGEAWRARVDLRVEDHDDPLAELERLLGLWRAYELAGAADELMAAERADEAGALYRRAAELAPGSDELLFWAGLAIAHAGDLDEGVDAVRRAAEVAAELARAARPALAGLRPGRRRRAGGARPELNPLSSADHLQVEVAAGAAAGGVGLVDERPASAAGRSSAPKPPTSLGAARRASAVNEHFETSLLNVTV